MSNWRKSLRDYSSMQKEIDKEMEAVFAKESKMEEEGTGMYSSHFKDLNEIRKRFRDACKKITSIKKPTTTEDFFAGDTSTSGDSETDDELPSQDRIKPLIFSDDRIKHKLTRDQMGNLFETEKQQEEWLKEVLKKGETDPNKVLDRLEYAESEDEEDKVLEELEREWKKMEGQEMPEEEREEVARMRKRIEESLNPDRYKKKKGRTTYLQRSLGDPSEPLQEEKEKTSKKKYPKTKKEIYKGFCNKI